MLSGCCAQEPSSTHSQRQHPRVWMGRSLVTKEHTASPSGSEISTGTPGGVGRRGASGTMSHEQHWTCIGPMFVFPGETVYKLPQVH